MKLFRETLWEIVGHCDAAFTFSGYASAAPARAASAERT
jgi:hypothetical protein